MPLESMKGPHKWLRSDNFDIFATTAILYKCQFTFQSIIVLITFTEPPSYYSNDLTERIHSYSLAQRHSNMYRGNVNECITAEI